MSKEPEWCVMPLDWPRHPKCRKLRQADPANPDRWQVLVCIATSCRAEGRLVTADRTPLTPEDLAWDHDRDESAWVAFVDLAIRLGLLGRSEETLYVKPWAAWNRDAAKAQALEDDMYRKRAERAEIRLKATELELAQARAVLSGPVRACPGLSEPVPPVRLEESRSEETRLDQTRNEETRYEETQTGREERSDEARICLSDFSEIDFLSVADDQHRLLKGKKLSGGDRSSLLKDAKGEKWADAAAWGDRAAALVLAVDRTRHRIDAGKLDREGNTWYYAIQAAPSFFVLAEQINIQNRLNPSLGEPLMALEAGP